jgi:hypothetical protein
MATLVLDQALRTRDSVVDVAGNLPVGRYVVRLLAETIDGQRLQAEMNIRVVRALEPRPLDPFNPVNPINPLRPT